MSLTAEYLFDIARENDGTPATPRLDSGLQGLVAAAALLDLPCDAMQIWHFHGKTTGAFETIDILRAARRIGLRADVMALRAERLDRLPTPMLLRARDTGAKGDAGAFTVVVSAGAGGLTIRDPLTGEEAHVPPQEVKRRFAPQAILLARAPGTLAADGGFGFAWFLPSILKHAARFRRVIIAALCLQLFALVSPVLSQLVIDRVLVSRQLQSLDVLVIGMLAIAVFDPLMSYFRNLVFSHLASGVNSELSARVYRHLVSLPLSYFRTRQTGDIIARVRELDGIRNFLTGSALMLVLDLAFVGVFLAVMFRYAAQLTWLVVASLAVYLLIWTVIAPALRRRVETSFERNADNTAFLTEAVTGIETVKSLAVGDRFRREWEDRLAAYLRASFRTSMMGNWGGGAIGLVQRVLSALLLWFGVRMVMAGDLSIGQLVAFNMLAGHVTMPILRMAQIWQDFQHVGVSIRRIGDILNHPAEPLAAPGRSSLGKIVGEVELRKVTFRYSVDGAEVLRRLSLHVRPGEKIGVTGLSGSGKSTITKLIQRLYVPQSGQVLVDGVDLALADPAMLRRQMGVVLQESFLFNGSVRENIALGDPGAGQARIEEVARRAGAHGFITALPGGYEAQVGERGGALSGGQRQRIAIARALLADPAIVIFDEATSALDYESEAAILQNLPQILEGRTAIMIAHRLNAMRQCDRIIVLEKGEIVEQGPHAALLGQGGRYAQLWRMQNG
ncbi:type I secretion system permease/ATPase [Phyllobacterium phragmitis]|uniref:Type I secretion system permease/ATPase n=1 Tax=Phyllobacterium phragmitis TaxID=2670329 RepID=A0A2S9IJU6_9HYPH|nr:type I secretion system permease/ATPase [Phyllobacterium phragmitis]PRD40772.1 type I secretion system permease/ATPase [Phyllobacterium phragmitis]